MIFISLPSFFPLGIFFIVFYLLFLPLLFALISFIASILRSHILILNTFLISISIVFFLFLTLTICNPHRLSSSIRILFPLVFLSPFFTFQISSRCLFLYTFLYLFYLRSSPSPSFHTHLLLSSVIFLFLSSRFFLSSSTFSLSLLSPSSLLLSPLPCRCQSARASSIKDSLTMAQETATQIMKLSVNPFSSSSPTSTFICLLVM